MPSYSSEQRRNIRKLRRTAVRKGASPREAKALLEAAGVESNYRHLPYGDRDSQGILQQRPSQGWGSGESVETDAGQFLAAAAKVNRAGFKGSAGQLAQAVQRSAFPGRYDQRSSEADKLLKRFSPSPRKDGSVRKQTKTGYSYSPGVDRSDQRQALMQTYLAERGKPGSLLALKSGLDVAVDVPGKVTYGPEPPKPGRRAARGSQNPQGRPKAKVRELFWNGPGAINIDEGKRVPKGYVSGHTDHAHFAADDPEYLLWAAKEAQRMGLSVREFEPYDKVDPVHIEGSFHYQKTKRKSVNKAMDVSGDPKLVARWARRVAA